LLAGIVTARERAIPPVYTRKISLHEISIEIIGCAIPVNAVEVIISLSVVCSAIRIGTIERTIRLNTEERAASRIVTWKLSFSKVAAASVAENVFSRAVSL
jgi:hypothetical protein